MRVAVTAARTEFTSSDMPNRAEEEAREKAGEEAWKKEMSKRQAIGQQLEKLYPSQPVPKR